MERALRSYWHSSRPGWQGVGICGRLWGLRLSTAAPVTPRLWRKCFQPWCQSTLNLYQGPAAAVRAVHMQLPQLCTSCRATPWPVTSRWADRAMLLRCAAQL